MEYFSNVQISAYQNSHWHGDVRFSKPEDKTFYCTSDILHFHLMEREITQFYLLHNHYGTSALTYLKTSKIERYIYADF